MKYPVVSFNTGEVSPQVDARSDVDKYRSACRILENMIPRIYGPATRRPGTRYIDTCNGVARVLPFVYSNTIAYILLLENLAMWFYCDGGRVLDTGGRRLKLDTPYLAADLSQIQYKQLNDVLRLTHGSYAPRQLDLVTANSFTLTPIVFEDGPFLKRNDIANEDGIMLTPSVASETSSGAIDVTGDTGCAYSASTTYNSTMGASHAFDGNLTPPGSFWQSSLLAADNQWVMCQWTGGQTITRVRLTPHVAPPHILSFLPDYAYNPRHIFIQASNDNVTWTKIKINGWSGQCSNWSDGGAELGMITSPTEWVDFTLDNAASYLYWRVYIVDSYSTVLTRIHEIEMMATTTSWGTTGTLSASAPVFDPGHVGAIFAVTQPRVNTSVTGTMTSPATGVIGSSLLVEGAFTFTTHGVWTGTVVLERSIDNTNWEHYNQWTGSADAQVQFTGTEDENNIYYRINVTAMSANTAAGATLIPSVIECELNVNSSTQTGIAQITGYTSSTLVSMTVLKNFASTNADTRWSEGCWSAYRGFPKCMTFFEDRAVYASTEYQPQTVWFSATGDYEDFEEGINGADSFSLTMNSDTRCAIQWISATEALIVGTASSEWRIRSSAYDEPLTPMNFSCKQQTTYGSTDLQAVAVNDALLFVDFVGRRVRECTYDGNKDKYLATDLSALAEHITETGLVATAYQKNPDPILWAVRDDGTLLSMTYEREQNVIAWARHPFKCGPGVTGELTGGSLVTTTRDVYPTLQELTAAEIPATPAAPADTALSAPVSITSAGGLQTMTPGNHYSIDADIDMTGVVWTPLTFNSASAIVIDGNDHTISNLSLKTTGGTNIGFIGLIDGAGGGQIRNLHFSDCSIGGHIKVAIFCAEMKSDADGFSVKNVTLTNCALSHECAAGYAAGRGLRFGLLCGTVIGNGATFYGCTATSCTITAAGANALTAEIALVGGLFGDIDDIQVANDTNVIDCHVVGGTMTLNRYEIGQVGGFSGAVGFSTAVSPRRFRFYDCSTSMEITCTIPVTETEGYIHQLAGFTGDGYSVSFTSCRATGDITVDATGLEQLLHIAGFVAQAASTAYLTATNCYCTGDIHVTDGGGTVKVQYVGGFGGEIHEDAILLRCYSTTSITFDTDIAGDDFYVGGFLAAALGEASQLNSVDRCWCEGDITFNGAVSGDDVFGEGYIAGFCGFVETDGTSSYQFTNCYTWSSIVMNSTYSSALGITGFVGPYPNLAATEFVNCYCAQTDTAAGSGYTGQIPTEADSWGFSNIWTFNGAYNLITATAIYYDNQTSAAPQGVIGEPKTTDWLQTKSNFEAAGWDFDTIWVLDGIATTVDTRYDYSSSGLGPNSVAVIPSSTEDEVWVVVSRVIGGSIVRYLEQMQPRDFGSDQDDCWFVDSGLSLDTADADGIVSGLEHLEGEEVVILADGAVRPRQTVTGGLVNTGEPILRKAIVGLPFRYKLKPMRFDLTVDGGTKGTLKRFAELVISFFESLNVCYGTDDQLTAGKLFNIDFRTTEAYGSPPALYTGDKVVTCEGGHNVEDPIIVTGDDPCPVTVRAMIPRIEISGR